VRVDELHDLCADPLESQAAEAQQPVRAAALAERGAGRVRDARRIAGEHHQIGESQASPSEQRGMENTGYAGEGNGGVPKKKPEQPKVEEKPK